LAEDWEEVSEEEAVEDVKKKVSVWGQAVSAFVLNVERK
jgi:hypothetical protein